MVYPHHSGTPNYPAARSLAPHGIVKQQFSHRHKSWWTRRESNPHFNNAIVASSRWTTSPMGLAIHNFSPWGSNPPCRWHQVPFLLNPADDRGESPRMEPRRRHALRSHPYRGCASLSKPTRQKNESRGSTSSRETRHSHHQFVVPWWTFVGLTPFDVLWSMLVTPIGFEPTTSSFGNLRSSPDELRGQELVGFEPTSPMSWCIRHDSNVRPPASKAGTLSN